MVLASPSIGSCRFCAVANGSFRTKADEPLACTSRYFAMPTIGSLVPGWVLICTNDHRSNFAASYADPELIEIRLRVANALSRKFCLPVQMFEHGAVTSGSKTGCGVDHAHLHLVAIDTDLLRYQPDVGGLSWRPSKPSLIEMETAGAEYLFYANDALDEDPAGYLARPKQPTSQFFRKAIANALNRPMEYDYRAYPHLDNAFATTNALHLE